MCHGFSHFPGFLHCFVMVQLATSSIRVNGLIHWCLEFHLKVLLVANATSLTEIRHKADILK